MVTMKSDGALEEFPPINVGEATGTEDSSQTNKPTQQQKCTRNGDDEK
jgi:hypothetical protein